MKPTLPVVEELTGSLAADDAFRRMSRLPHCLFLDSATADHARKPKSGRNIHPPKRFDPRLGRYSFVAADPFEFVQMWPHDRGGLQIIEQRLQRFRQEKLSGLPPFQGGAAGLFGYDLARQLELLAAPRYDEFEMPALAVGLYDTVVAFDHLEDRAWIISQGFPQCEPKHRLRRAEERLREVREILTTDRQDTSLWHGHPGRVVFPSRAGCPCHKIGRQRLCPQYDMPAMEGLSSNFTREQYLSAVRRGIDYILAGDIFQVNLAQRLLHPATCDSVSLYERLRSCNPAPFAGYFDLGEFQIVSASPERFVCVRDRRVESRPIKGTRPRHDDPAADEAVQEGLLESEKDRAENVMIVDLLRNDLSRVCRPDSVAVAELCRLETYQCVHHLVSSIEGRLADDCGPLDLVRAAFPGGSVTGAPKVRAMEIITELEQTARGAYCGSLGYVGFDGAVDLNILIRTITAGRGWWQASVGGAVVSQSSPEDEYEETWHKAEGLLRALG